MRFDDKSIWRRNEEWNRFWSYILQGCLEVGRFTWLYWILWKFSTCWLIERLRWESCWNRWNQASIGMNISRSEFDPPSNEATMMLPWRTRGFLDANPRSRRNKNKHDYFGHTSDIKGQCTHSTRLIITVYFFMVYFKYCMFFYIYIYVLYAFWFAHVYHYPCEI